MTREGILKHKEIFDAWLDGAEIEYFCIVNKKWFATKNPAWNLNIEYRIKSTRIEFEDCDFNEIEYITQTDATLLEVNSTKFEMSHRKGFIKNKKVAEAYAVLPQLIRLVDEYNEGWVPDWEKERCKFIIGYYRNKIHFIEYSYTQRLLAFKSAEIRDKFLEDHRDLIEIAKPLL